MELIRNAADRQGRAQGLASGARRRQRVPGQDRGEHRPAVPFAHLGAAAARRGAGLRHQRQNHHHPHGGQHARLARPEGVHQPHRFELHPRRGFGIALRSDVGRRTRRRHRGPGARRSLRRALRQAGEARLLSAAQRDARPARPLRRDRQHRAPAQQSRRGHHRHGRAQPRGPAHRASRRRGEHTGRRRGALLRT